MSWLFYDYETLSQNVFNCPVVCYAGVTVDPDRFKDNPYTLAEIRKLATFVKFDIKEQVDSMGCIIEELCLEWWAENVDKETRDRLLTPSPSDRSLKELPDVIRETVGNDSLDIVYTRGNTFDPVITKRVCDYLGVDEPYAWWCIRDTRSMLDGMLWETGINQKFTPDVGDDNFSLHDPVDDIALDILRIQSVVSNYV